MRVITIPSLDKYQHYKDRPTNPWIKWEKKCLRDYKFCQLTNAERWLFIGLVILATENNNEIPADFHYIADKICYFPPEIVRKEGENGARMVRKRFSPMREFNKSILKLIELKLIAIKRIAKRYQNADLDKSRVDKIRKEESKIPFYKSSKEILKEKMSFK